MINTDLPSTHNGCMVKGIPSYTHWKQNSQRDNYNCMHVEKKYTTGLHNYNYVALGIIILL